jgi:hypothetical protein
MASIRIDTPIDQTADRVWAALRDVGAAHRPFAGVLTDCRLEGDARVVTFANGMSVRELIVDIDERERRVVWAALGDPLKHHNASLQVFADGEQRCRVTWIADLLPNDAAPNVRALMEQGSAALAKNLAR